MADLARPSPRNKPVSLFVTCIIDALYPPTGIAVVEVLEHLGLEVRFPQAQTCCGQPGFNSGFHDDARRVARHFLQVFEDAELIVTPSGSCAAMLRHYYPQLFADDPVWHERARRAASITWEFSEFLVDGLGIQDLGARLAPTRVAFHDACHGLRGLGLQAQARALAGSIEGVTLVEMEGAQQCCGFGGLFAIKLPDISNAMLQEKMQAIEATPADVFLTGDCSCLTHINGGLARQKRPQRLRHVADLLAEGLQPVKPVATAATSTMEETP
ncbi:MAG: (Fe-S)-binding protein [Anaerolineae bacterium]|nr:(Fe-S)-binding protein [Anaerolineae bacterium]